MTKYFECYYCNSLVAIRDFCECKRGTLDKRGPKIVYKPAEEDYIISHAPIVLKESWVYDPKAKE